MLSWVCVNVTSQMMKKMRAKSYPCEEMHARNPYVQVKYSPSSATRSAYLRTPPAATRFIDKVADSPGVHDMPPAIRMVCDH
jgi:hypothetical protein